jgi:hypothetical protein
MCMTCGCGEPDERHGKDACITNADLVAAAEAAGLDEQQAIDNIAHTYVTKVAPRET